MVLPSTWSVVLPSSSLSLRTASGARRRMQSAKPRGVQLLLLFGLLPLAGTSSRWTGGPASREIEPQSTAAAHVCDVREYGAAGDGVSEDTAHVQRALDQCGGGGSVPRTVLLPAGGTFLLRPVTIPAGANLRVEVSGSVKALFPRSIPPSFPVLARACLWCLGARTWRVNLPRGVTGTPSPRLTPRIVFPPFGRSFYGLTRCCW